MIILVFMFDAFVAGPVGAASGFWPNLFPLHHPSHLVVDAALNPDVDVARYGWSVAYTFVLLGVAALSHRREALVITLEVTRLLARPVPAKHVAHGAARRRAGPVRHRVVLHHPAG